MAFKHQTQSFRNRNGQRFECWTDAPDRMQAVEIVRDLRAQGRKAFAEKMDGGAFYRVFATE